MLRQLISPLLGAGLLFATALAAGAPAPSTERSALAGRPYGSGADSLQGVGAAPQTGPAPVSALLDTLLHNSDNRTETIKALIATGDEKLAGFFQNLYKGNVYEYASPQPGGEKKQLVIGGAEEEREGETWAPLSSIYPMEPIKDASGAALFVKTSDLVELETDREVRSLIQPVLTAMDLKSSDIAKRKSAALTLGEAGDTLEIPLLLAAGKNEKNPSVAHLLDEAVARLGLRSANPSVRKASAARLGEIHSVNVLPELKAMAASADGQPVETDAGARAAVIKAISKIESFQSFTGVVQNLFTGLSLGSILILMALGLAIIFGLMGVINMAHGEFMMIGAYATYLIQNGFQKFLPPQYFGYFLLVSLPLSFFAAGGVGVIVESLIIKRLYGRPLETLLATWGLSLLFIQTARSIFGDLTAVSSPELLAQGWEIFPQVVLPFNRIFIIFLTALIVSGMGLAFYRTSLGTKIRAVTQNRSMSSCLGIATRRVDALTFGLGTGIAGIAGCALTQIGNVDPGMGQNYIVDSFMVVVTGGVGKLMGTVLSGMGIGTLNKFLEPFLQSVYAKVVLLGLVILFLQNRPSGLFPAKGRNEDL
jgi:urea transport system permease protein